MKGGAGKSALTGLLWAGKTLREGRQRALKAQPALQRLHALPERKLSMGGEGFCSRSVLLLSYFQVQFASR